MLLGQLADLGRVLELLGHSDGADRGLELLLELLLGDGLSVTDLRRVDINTALGSIGAFGDVR